MSVNPPPNPNVAIFNNLYWIQGNTPLTEEEAAKRFLKFPVAQGKETLQEIIVNGPSTFNDDITIAANQNIIMDAGTGYIEFPDGTQQTTAGGGATPGLSAVLAVDNNAGFQAINQVAGMGLQDYTSIISFGPPANPTYEYSALGITALNGGTISAVNSLMETQSVHITGGNGTPYVDIIVTLGSNVYADTTYSVFYSWYYGFTGSGGTWNAKDTANTLGNGIVYSKTATQFQFYCSKGQGNNINAYLNFQIVYNPLGGAPAVYS